MFVGVLVFTITIAIMLGFMARRPNVGTGAGAERRPSHSTAGTAAFSNGTFRRGDQKNPRRQHQSPAGQYTGSVETNHRSPLNCFDAPRILSRRTLMQIGRAHV